MTEAEIYILKDRLLGRNADEAEASTDKVVKTGADRRLPPRLHEIRGVVVSPPSCDHPDVLKLWLRRRLDVQREHLRIALPVRSLDNHLPGTFTDDQVCRYFTNHSLVVHEGSP